MTEAETRHETWWKETFLTFHESQRTWNGSVAVLVLSCCGEEGTWFGGIEILGRTDRHREWF